MSTEQNKAVARRIVKEAFQKGKLDVLDDDLAEDFIDHQEMPGIPQGRDGVKQKFKVFRRAFPDVRVTLEDELADGDLVAHRAVTSATHQGEFLGVAPTGKEATWKEMHMVRFANGKAVEHWAVIDTLSLMRQLGAVPEPGGG